MEPWGTCVGVCVSERDILSPPSVVGGRETDLHRARSYVSLSSDKIHRVVQVALSILVEHWGVGSGEWVFNTHTHSHITQSLTNLPTH